LQVGKEKQLVLYDRTADTAAEDVLHKLFFGGPGNRDWIALGVQPRRSIELKNVAVKVVRARLGYQRNLRAAAAS
jgi:hypothetical protein